jgi:hypothetical protein
MLGFVHQRMLLILSRVHQAVATCVLSGVRKLDQPLIISSCVALVACVCTCMQILQSFGVEQCGRRHNTGPKNRHHVSRLGWTALVKDTKRLRTVQRMLGLPGGN